VPFETVFQSNRRRYVGIQHGDMWNMERTGKETIGYNRTVANDRFVKIPYGGLHDVRFLMPWSSSLFLRWLIIVVFVI
jgi:hypothetical protein